MTTTSASSEKPAARPAPGKSAAVAGAITLPLSQLRLSEFNIRHPHEGELAWNVEDLEASILAVGLISPLGVHPLKKPRDAYGVFAGGRRLHALQNLLARDAIASDYPVACMVRRDTSEMLLEMSVMENVQRVALRPTVEFAAFARLADLGIDVPAIAARFATTELHVRQRMQLGRLHPSILEALGQALISEDLARAYASTSDQALQIRVYREMSAGGPHYPRNVRNAIRGGAAAANAEAMLEVVGIEAYLEAGGTLEHDLFEGGRRIEQPGTLSELYYARLQQQEAELAARLPEQVVITTSGTNLGRPLFAGATFEPEARDRLAAIDRRTDEIVERLEALTSPVDDTDDYVADRPEHQGAVEALRAEMSSLEDESEAIHAGATPVLPEGPVVALMVPTASGPRLDGYYRPAGYVERAETARPAGSPTARPPAEGAGLQTASYVESPDPWVKAETGLTQDGIQVMRSHRRAILRAMMIEPGSAGGQQVAGRYLTFCILRMGLQEHRRHGEHVYAQHAGLAGYFTVGGDPTGANEVQAHAGAMLWADAVERVRSAAWMATKDLAQAFTMFCAMDAGAVEELTAVAGALLLDRSLRAPGYKVPLHDQVAEAIGMADDRDIRECYWRPDAAFFAWLPKAKCLATVGQISPRAAKLMAKLSKSDLDAACERFFRADPRDVEEFSMGPAQVYHARLWIPDFLRFDEGPPPLARAKGGAAAARTDEVAA